MELVYRNDLKDMMAFFKYHHLQSLAGKKSRVRGYVIINGMAALGHGYSVYSNGTSVNWQVLFGTLFCVNLMAFAYYVIVWPVYIWFYVKFSMRKGKNKGFGEGIELLISDGYLHIKNANSEAKLKISDLERVVEYKGYTYVYTGSLTALYIPEEKVSSGDYSAFCKELGSILGNST